MQLCNQSFIKGVFPNELKLAKVVPIFKQGNRELCQNYRPVSILPCLSKVFERLMYDRLISFLHKHRLICELQFGFRKGRSSFMALTEAIDLITNAVDKGDSIVGVFLDLSKAFDTVNHDIMLQKLHKYGVRGIPYEWFRSYLNNRRRFISFNGTISEEDKITCGVPQGSILGPLLFLIYINDLTTVSENYKALLFADDANLFFTKSDCNDVDYQICNELTKIQEWMNCNALSLNLNKTQYMIYTSKGRDAQDLDIKLNGTKIQRVFETKFLGVKIDAKLTWIPHIKFISKKLWKSIGIILKARKKIDTATMKSLYYAFVYPYLSYCNHVWGKTYMTHLKPLVLLQKKIVRIVTGSSYLAQTEPLMKQNKILNINSINDYSRAIFLYNFTRSNLPTMFQNYFDYNREYHPYNTRYRNDLHTASYNLDVRKFSIRAAGPVLWNALPREIRDSPTVHSFKRRLKLYLSENQRNPY